MALSVPVSAMRRCAILLLVAAACSDADDSLRPTNVSAEVSESIHTVVRVRWNTESASIGYVEYGTTKALGSRTPLEDTETTEHAYSLLGLRAETTYFYRAVTWDGRETGSSPIQSVVTGTLPVGIPAFDVQGSGNDLFTLVPVLPKTAVLIIDSEGEVVWYHRDERDLDVYRARLALNGKDLIYNAASVSGEPADNSEVVRVALDGSGSSSIPVPLLAHDFVEHPDGTLAAIVIEYRDHEGVSVRGDTIVEIDAMGNQNTVWSSWDCFDPVAHPGDSVDLQLGWTFANALDYDPNEQAYYVGMRDFSSIAKVDRATGSCEWVLGLTASTFDFAPGSTRFLHQHQFHVLGNRIVVFDNEGSPNRESRVLEYELDFDAKLATQVWSYTSTPSVYSFVLGEPTRLDGGDTFIAWATAGQLERVTPAGESIWKLNSAAGTVFAFNTLATTLYSANPQNPQ
jgi:hypothetical protein